MSTRLKQLLIVAAGAVVAIVMVFLGLWQAQVFVDKGNRTVADRAEQPAVALSDHLDSPGLGDLYGKQVIVTGHYLPDQEITIPADGGVRVLTAFELADGRVLPVVRGFAADGSPMAGAPTGERTEQGLLLPGEGDSDVEVGDGQLGSVRMPLLAQHWTQQLVAGFVTLDGQHAAAQGLAQAAVTLPEGQGEARNAGYALQWWVFAAFGLGMTLKIAHAVGARERRAREEEARAELEPAVEGTEA